MADADRRGVNPGSDALRDLFIVTSPCLVLIDEWVAFVRQLYGKDDLPAGSFDANLTFVQSLTEAARQAPQTLVVASIPASDIEVGGEGGQVALERIKHTFARMESPWRPASAEEGFEIVRRRLFQPLPDREAFVQRDAVARAFAELYRQQPSEFPPACREGDYARRIQAAYPIHPELFDRLYTDWSSLDRFQRTRGVLRLMAAVIHALWERQDAGLLIMPASVPIDAPGVHFELTHYLEDTWVPVIEKDVDGPASLPLQLDRENPNLGRYSACRRVARTLYLGSAPTLHTGQRGLDARSIALGCDQPGESIATFGDALRRLTDQATHLYADGSRYWFSTQPSVTRLAQDRAALLSDDAVEEEIVRRLRGLQRSRGEFHGVHLAPPSSADVPDEPEARLVVLGPGHPHVAKAADSPARQAAAALLEGRGSSPRRYRNALVFLAPDQTRLRELAAVRQAIAWSGIQRDQNTLNLDAFQRAQAENKVAQAEETVARRIPECYTWLLVPTQAPQGPVAWEELRLTPNEKLIENASRKLVGEEHLLTAYAPTLLRADLDRIPLWRGEHVGTRQLWEDFAQYPYLPRLKDAEVLARSIADGVRSLTWTTDTFAYAEGWDEQRQRYRGLHAGEGCGITIDANSLVVQPASARRQLDAEVVETQVREGAATADVPATDYGAGTVELTMNSGTTVTLPRPEPQPVVPRRFYGTVRLDPLRAGRDAGKVADEVIQHLAGLDGAEVEVTLEIQVQVPYGIPEPVVRTVAENARVLKFTSAEFEER